MFRLEFQMRHSVYVILSCALLVGCGGSPEQTIDAEQEAFFKRMENEKPTQGTNDRRKRDEIRAECSLGLRSGEQCSVLNAELEDPHNQNGQ
jgi:hypothetical protein